MYRGVCNMEIKDCKESDDISLTVLDKVISCKRELLMKHSTYFEAMFNSNMQESNATEIQMQDVSYDALETLVNFVETGEISLDEKNAYSVLETACMLHFNEIEEKCCKFLESNISLRTCLYSMHLADIHALNSLYNTTKIYVSWNFADVTADDHFLSAPFEAVKDLLGCEELNINSEAEVLYAALKWIHRIESKCNTTVEADGLLGLVHYGNIDKKSFDKILNVWEQKCCICTKILKEERSRQSTTRGRSCPHYITVIGGIDEDGKHLSDVMIIDPDTRQISSLTQLPFLAGPDDTANGYQACVVGMDLYITGGERKLGKSRWINDVWCFHMQTRQWYSPTKLIQPRRHHSTCASNASLFVIGGFGRHRILSDSVEEFNTKTGQWMTLPALLQATYSAAVTICQNHLYVIKHDIQTFDFQSQTWTFVHIPLPFEINIHSAVTLNDKIYLNGRFIYKLLEFDASKKEVNDLGEFAESHGASCCIDNKIFVSGVGVNRNMEYFDLNTRQFEIYVKFNQRLEQECVVSLPIFPEYR